MQLVVFFNGSMDLASAHLLAPKPKFLAMALPPQCWGAAPKAKYDIWHCYLANVVAAPHTLPPKSARSCKLESNMLQVIDLVCLFILIPTERSSLYPVKNAHGPR
jgi:hypothetical protein